MLLGILCSGNLGLTVLKQLTKYHSISFVATDSNSMEIIRYAKEKGLIYYIGNPRKGKLASFLEGISIDILISINYLFLIEEDIIKIPKRIAFNIHGSLLPRYRGRTPHVWAIINNEKKCGITAHLIDCECDAGDILYQKEIFIEKKDTGFSILQKYQKEYLQIILNVIEKIKKNTLTKRVQEHDKATIFGKRVPEDGLINWDWQYKRIYNWVRAQSYPYPGAFTFAEDKKLIIDFVEPSDIGFDSKEENGKIIRIKNSVAYVKTPNKVLKITKTRNSTTSLLKTNMVLR